MARTRHLQVTRVGHRVTRTPYYKRHRKALHALRELEGFALLLLADCEDEEDEAAAMLVACLAMEEAHAVNNIRRYGVRGHYNRTRTSDFYEILLYFFTDRQFKAWLR